TAVSVSNYQDGTGPAWYLLDVSRAIKPIIFQKRRNYDLKAMTKVDDEAVFMEDVYRYGVDARVNAGFGLWQFAYCSKAPFNAENYAAARAAMKAFKADGGRPLGVNPGLLVVPSSLEGPARKLVVKDAEGGNEWAGSAEVLSPSWLG
ncbi:Mu-like prophage major head subunit gpT family protein, partial [Pseudomonas sp.]|uniref:Mu-like prophage major head subunit gpT family protein n=1 Tax=Pseudomonas sp. TaxID=306 RepID=UPI002897FB29